MTIRKLILLSYEVAIMKDLRLFYEGLPVGYLLGVHGREMGDFGERGEFFMHG